MLVIKKLTQRHFERNVEIARTLADDVKAEVMTTTIAEGRCGTVKVRGDEVVLDGAEPVKTADAELVRDVLCIMSKDVQEYNTGVITFTRGNTPVRIRQRQDGECETLKLTMPQGDDPAAAIALAGEIMAAFYL